MITGELKKKLLISNDTSIVQMYLFLNILMQTGTEIGSGMK